jgi:prepilin-type processing-associated H-X9-DG protein
MFAAQFAQISEGPLLTRQPPEAALEWARTALGSDYRLTCVEPLRGGVSHANHLLRLSISGQPDLEVVLRRWVRADWALDDPEFSPAQEAATYGLLAGSAIPAPRLLATDLQARACDVPAILLSRAPGVRLSAPPDMRAYLSALAAALLPLHDFDRAVAATTLPPYRPYYERERIFVPTWARRLSVWSQAIDIGGAGPPPEPAYFIHRDYHPGNTLWQDGHVSAIVDWTSASFGPKGVDLAHMRANLAMAHGLAAADEFLADYLTLADPAYHYNRYWDLRDAIDFLPEMYPGSHSRLALDRLEEFAAAALAELC